MKLTLQAKLKNGVLWQAVEKAGSQVALARILGVEPTEVGRWINFKAIPPDTPRMWEVEARLIEFAGITFADAFPGELREMSDKKGRALFETSLSTTREVPVSQLTTQERSMLTTEIADDRPLAASLTEAVDTVLGSLPERTQKVLEARFGLHGESERTLEEIGEEMHRCKETVRRIEAQGLRKLRHPERRKYLLKFLDALH